MPDDSRSVPVAIYAPRPMSTVLWDSPAVALAVYEPGVGLSAAPARTVAFAGIDLDLWFRSVVAQLDAVLTPELVTAVDLLDTAAGTQRANVVRAQRERIASALAGLLVPVRGDAADAADAEGVVRQVWRASLLERFGDLYETQALLAAGPEMRLALLAGPQTVHDASGAVVVSSAYDLGDGDGDVDVPLALRAFPEPPAALAQDAAPDAAPARDAIDAAKRWRYRCSYARPFHDPRDVVTGRVRFDIAASADAGAALAAGHVGDEDGRVFAGLAQVVAALPVVAADLRRVLRRMDGAETLDAGAARDAAVAVDALIVLLERIDVPPAPTPLAAAPVPAAISGPEDQSCAVEFRLAESASDDGRYVLTLVLEETTGLPLDAFAVHVGDASAYVPHPLERSDAFRRSFAYALAGTEPPQFLSAADGQRVGERAIEIAGLDAFAQPAARAAFAVHRNATLSPAFVYRTPATGFASPCVVSLDAEAPIALSAPLQPVGAHLAGLFASLLADAAMDALELGLHVSYAYDLANASGLPAIVVPVALQPASVVALHGADLDELLARSQAEIVAWFAAMVPPSGGTLRFDITVSDADTPQAAPLLRMREVEIPLAAIEPPLIVAGR